VSALAPPPPARDAAPAARAAGARAASTAAHAAARRRPGAQAPALPLWLARGATLLALLAFGELHWMALLEPAQPGRAWVIVALGALAVAAYTGIARLGGRRRPLAAIAAALPLAALALLAGGVADELLRPDRWGELAAGISRGIDALPGVRVPYRGLDEWTRTVIPLGGSALGVLATGLAFWPRRRRIGHPHAALLALFVLYAVPAVALDFSAEFVRGAALALLVLAFLVLERLQARDAGAAGLVAVAVVVAGLVAAPALDRSTPWFDYENWALETSASKSTAYSWDHSYGPLRWPRDGREMLRVKAPHAAYWKAENLDLFDGLHWRRADATLPVSDEVPDDWRAIARWTQTIRVTVRNLRSDQFVTAGYAAAVLMPRVDAIPSLEGTFEAGRTLHRGDAYTARVYTPDPTERERREAGTDYPAALARYRTILLPVTEQPTVRLTRATFPAWGDPSGLIRVGPPGASDDQDEAVRLLANSPYARTFALARELRRLSGTPESYVQRVRSLLGDGYGYTETPPRSARNLEGFLFDAKQGYCQQFSGAMALLLRMGGIPARVATGFSAGSFDSETGEYVVRDLDAHSWVEVWYPGYGWVTFDPTPALAPARSQPTDDAGSTPTTSTAQAPTLPGDAPAQRPDATTAAPEASSPWPVVIPVAVGLVALAVVAWLLRRRRRGRRAPLAELQRALRRARREPAPGTTLHALEAAFARTPAAAGYVRTLREARYGGRPAAPTAAQRRALRAELARGGGLLGRLRAWWALPPGVH
jgi:protein-glutamine gamma-glutamyltransferase